MLTLSYNKSPLLQQRLSEIDKLREKLLITMFSPQQEIELKWNNIVERIRYSYLLEGRSISADHIHSSLVHPRSTEDGKKIINYKNVVDFISHDWIMTDSEVTSRTIVDIAELLDFSLLPNHREALDRNFQYLQVSPDHPVIQSGLSFLSIKSLDPTQNFFTLATFGAYLFLAKYGYNFRDFINIEEQIFLTKDQYEIFNRTITQTSPVTDWLEYFTANVKNNLNRLLERLKMIEENDTLTSFTQLNQRQKQILSLFDEPGLRLTNRDVQKKFTVSQITASRDLAKLATLGLIFPAGKGRSVYYTKV